MKYFILTFNALLLCPLNFIYIADYQIKFFYKRNLQMSYEVIFWLLAVVV